MALVTGFLYEEVWLMPHFKCSECPHEWDGRAGQSIYDWYGASGEELEEQMPLELFMSQVEQDLLLIEYQRRAKHVGDLVEEFSRLAVNAYQECSMLSSAHAQTPPDTPK